MKRFAFIVIILMLAVTGIASAQKAQDDPAEAWLSHSVEGMKFRAPAHWEDITGELGNPAVQYALRSTEDNSTNLNIVYIDAGVALTPEQAQQELESSYPGQGIEVYAAEILEMPQGKTLRMEMTPINVNAQAHQYQYVFLSGTEVYFLTLTALEDVFEEFAPLFESIAHTVVLPSMPEAWPRTSGVQLSIQAPEGWQQQELAADSGLDFMLIDDETGSLIGGFVEEREAEYTQADGEAELLSWYEENGLENMGIEQLSLPLGEAVRGLTEVTYQASDGSNLTDAEFEYRIGYGNKVIVIIGRTAPEQAEELAPMFKAMVDTLLITG